MSRRSYTIAAILPLAFALLASGCNRGPTGQPSAPSQPAVAAPAPPPPPDLPAASVWQPDKALLEKLGAYQDIADYQVRVPEGWETTPMPASAPSVGKSLLWAGPRKADGRRPSLLVVVATPDDKASVRETPLEKLAEALIQSLAAQEREMKQTSTERGKISGLTFVRVATEAIPPGAAIKAKGMWYVGKDDVTIIALRIFDVEPYDEDALKLGAASIMTFRKKP